MTILLTFSFIWRLCTVFYSTFMYYCLYIQHLLPNIINKSIIHSNMLYSLLYVNGLPTFIFTGRRPQRWISSALFKKLFCYAGWRKLWLAKIIVVVSLNSRFDEGSSGCRNANKNSAFKGCISRNVLCTVTDYGSVAQLQSWWRKQWCQESQGQLGEPQNKFWPYLFIYFHQSKDNNTVWS